VTEPQEPRSTTPNHLTSDELSECAFSPETAPAGWLEHAEGCAQCSAELADLRLVLTQLAELPEPELPESVAIRLDAAVARAWQEADVEQEAAASASATRGRGTRRSWRKFAIPLSALALIAVAVVGVGAVLHLASSAGGSATSASAGAAPHSNGMITDPALASWVRSVLPETAGSATSGVQRPKSSSMAETARCATIPQRAGETVLTTSQRVFEGESATLVVYQYAQEPSSGTVYAVVYEGSCPSSKSEILAQGSVSR
jgi:hypothetical protein